MSLSAYSQRVLIDQNTDSLIVFSTLEAKRLIKIVYEGEKNTELLRLSEAKIDLYKKDVNNLRRQNTNLMRQIHSQKDLVDIKDMIIGSLQEELKFSNDANKRLVRRNRFLKVVAISSSTLFLGTTGYLLLTR